MIEKSVIEWDDFSGRVEAIERVEIRPRVAGTIEAVHFKEGQLVRKGDALFTIDPRPYQAEVARAEAAQAGAQARLVLTRTELDRTRKLVETHAVAQRELDQRDNAFREADAALKAADAAVLTTRLNLQYTAIAAPVSGRVSAPSLRSAISLQQAPQPRIDDAGFSVAGLCQFRSHEQAYIRYAANGIAGNTGLDKIPVSLGLANEDGYPHQGLWIRRQQARYDLGHHPRARRFDNANGLLAGHLRARRHGRLAAKPRC